MSDAKLTKREQPNALTHNAATTDQKKKDLLKLLPILIHFLKES